MEGNTDMSEEAWTVKEETPFGYTDMSEEAWTVKEETE